MNDHVLDLGRHLTSNQVKLLAYLLSHPCADCAERDPSVLEFHHVYTEEKEANISKLIRSNTWEAALKEINKCVVLCANCHRKRHALEDGWYSVQQGFLSAAKTLVERGSFSHA